MFRYFRVLSFLALLCFLVNCSDGNDATESNVFKTASYDYSLKISETLLEFAIDDETANVSRDLGFINATGEEGKGVLFLLNTFNNSLQLYAQTTGKLIRRITFDTKGPKGVGRVAAVHAESMDSIFIFPNADNTFFLIDSAAEKLEKYSYRPPDGYSNARVSSTFFASPPVVRNGKVFVKSLFAGNYSGMTNEELATKQLGYEIDLEHEQVKPSVHRFPQDYWAEKKKHYEFSLTSSGERIVYAFYGDHHVYAADPLGDAFVGREARSKYFTEKLENLPVGGSRDDRRRYFATTPHYGSIIYDKYREVYYRFCYPDIEVEAGDDIRLFVQFPKSFTVMILDKDLNVIGETPFTKNTNYVPSNVFVSPEGLYMSTNHRNSTENQEDYLSFRLFTLQSD